VAAETFVCHPDRRTGARTSRCSRPARLRTVVSPRLLLLSGGI